MFKIIGNYRSKKKTLEGKLKLKLNKVQQYENLEKYKEALYQLKIINKLAKENELEDLIKDTDELTKKYTKKLKIQDEMNIKTGLEERIKKAKYLAIRNRVEDAIKQLNDISNEATELGLKKIADKAQKLVSRYAKGKENVISLEKRVEILKSIAHAEEISTFRRYKDAINLLKICSKDAKKLNFNDLVNKCEDLTYQYRRFLSNQNRH